MDTPNYTHDCDAGCEFEGTGELDGKPVDLYRHIHDNGDRIELIVRDGDNGWDYHCRTLFPTSYGYSPGFEGDTARDYLNFLISLRNVA